MAMTSRARSLTSRLSRSAAGASERWEVTSEHSSWSDGSLPYIGSDSEGESEEPTPVPFSLGPKRDIEAILAAALRKEAREDAKRQRRATPPTSAGATARRRDSGMTEMEADAVAAAEGLVLVRVPDSATGFKGVSLSPPNTGATANLPFRARSKGQVVGYFASAASAALAYARHVKSEGSTTTRRAASPELTEAEAEALAAEEGLVLLRSTASASGFRGVHLTNGHPRSSRPPIKPCSKPFKAQLSHKGEHEYLGTYSSAHAAALAVARALGPEECAEIQATTAAATSSQPTMTEAEVEALAVAEGLQLVRSDKNSTGFKGVSRNGTDGTRPFKIEAGGCMGYYVTAAEAALAYARHLGPEGCAEALTKAAGPSAPPMTEAEAEAAAAAEGLVLMRANNNVTGFKGVSVLTPNPRRGSGPELVYMCRAPGRKLGGQACLGTFRSAGEAALAYARFLGPEGCAEVAAEEALREAPPPPAMTEAEAEALAAAEGLVLVRSATTASGFKGVFTNGTAIATPFIAKSFTGGPKKLGYFSSAAEAALAFARHLGPEGCAEEARKLHGPPEPPPTIMTVAEAEALAAAEGLVLVPSAGNLSGFLGVSQNASIRRRETNRFLVETRPGDNGGRRSLGTFNSAAEASLAYARHLGPEGSAQAFARVTATDAPLPPPMTMAEAEAAAAAEGLVLIRSNKTNTGFKACSRNGQSRAKPFKVQARVDGHFTVLGYHSSAAGAALAYARHLGPEGCAEAVAPPAPPPPPPPPMTEAEAEALAAAEGLVLVRAPENMAGWKGVAFNDTNPSRPFRAQITRPGSGSLRLGSFTGAAEAALCYARAVAADAAAAPTSMAAAGVVVTDAEEGDGLYVVRSVGRAAGYDSGTGTAGSSSAGGGTSKPFKAQIITHHQRGGRTESLGPCLGTFSSVAEAAACLARATQTSNLKKVTN